MEKLFNFLEKAKTQYQAIDELSKMLDEAHFTRIYETDIWPLEKGGSYYLIKDQSSLIAFKIGLKSEDKSFNIVASHSDSPNLKIKPNGLIKNKTFDTLNTEVYGGLIYSTWFDRVLGIAGRVVIKENDVLKSLLVDLDDNVIIPNLPIHLKSELNTNPNYNPQIDLLPLIGSNNYHDFISYLSSKINVTAENIISFDLSLYNKDKPRLIGPNKELFSASRIDNLECSFLSMEAFLESNNDDKINVYVCFNNEEVGSSTKQGADSTFLKSTLERIVLTISMKEECSEPITCCEKFNRALANSFLVSSDNAHSIHPNHPEKSDITNYSVMNKGIVIKRNCSERYTTDAISESLFKAVLQNANIPYQNYNNRSDQRGGSTLGCISTSHVSIPSIDIGLAQLAMHSSYETAGSLDIIYMKQGLIAFYNSHFKALEKDTYRF